MYKERETKIARLTKEQLKDKILNKYSNIIYVKSVEYEGERPFAYLICRECGYSWRMSAYDAYSDTRFKGCQNCKKKNRCDVFKKELYGKYKGRIQVLDKYFSSNMLFRCNVHNIKYRSSPQNMLKAKYGCIKCGLENKKITRKSIEEARSELKDKTDGEFIILDKRLKNVNDSVCIKHVVGCGLTFKKTFHEMINTPSCPYCPKVSKAENILLNILEDNNIKYSYQKRVEYNGRTHVFDFELPYYNMLIELQGEQHFLYNKDGIFGKSVWNDRKIRDEEKRGYANKNNKKLLEIKYNDFDTKMLVKILNDNGVKCTFNENISYTRPLYTKREMADYAWKNGIKAAADRFNKSRDTIRGYVKLIYNRNITDKKNDEYRVMSDEVATFYLKHSMRETIKKYGWSQNIIMRAFKDKYGISKKKYNERRIK